MAPKFDNLAYPTQNINACCTRYSLCKFISEISEPRLQFQDAHSIKLLKQALLPREEQDISLSI